MVTSLKQISQSVLGKFLAVFIVILLFVNFLALLAYIHHTHVIRYASMQQQAAREGVEIISLATLNPLKWEQYMVKAAKDPDIEVTTSVVPKYHQQFSDHSTRWEVYDALEHNNSSVLRYSYELGKKRWLNVRINSYLHFEHITFWVIIIGLLTSLIILFYAWSIQRFTVPLRKLTDVAGRMGVDLQAKPMPVYGPNLVKEAINSINKMQERILALLKERTLTLAALSHDLRTPITRLKLKAHFIRDDEQREKFVSDLDEMQQMLNDSLMLAQQNYQPKKMRSLDVVSLVESLCDDLADIGAAVRFNTDLNREVINGDPLLLKRAFANILQNGIKYGDKVVVNIIRYGDGVQVTIDDCGSGIPEAELEQVFDPFYRTEQSRSKETGGSGLGLAIANSIILSHNGSIQLVNLANGGLRVVVRLLVIT